MRTKWSLSSLWGMSARQLCMVGVGVVTMTTLLILRLSVPYLNQSALLPDTRDDTPSLPPHTVNSQKDNFIHLHNSNFNHVLVAKHAPQTKQKRITDKDHHHLVKTSGCRIPDVDHFDVSIRHLVLRGRPINCSAIAKPAVTRVDKEYLRLNLTLFQQVHGDVLEFCEYQPILRDETSDDLFTYGKRVTFKKSIKMKHEFVRVACYSRDIGMVYVNFHAFVIDKEYVDDRSTEKVKAFHTKSARNPPNVLLLGVDSVSRLNFLRQMPNTRRFILNTLKGIELTGFNKVADNTYVNLVPMLAGKYVQELPWEERTSEIPFDEFPFMWKNFTDAGYRTLMAEDAPGIAIFNYNKAGFQRPPTDYYLRPFSLATEEHTSIWNSEHDCIGDKLETGVVLDYVSDFMQRFKPVRHFALAFLTRLTHDGINRAGSADEPYLNFFSTLHKNGHFDNTFVVFFSDHGMRFGPIRETYIGKLEERLPFMFVIPPKWFRHTYPEHHRSLQLNSHRLTTFFDLHRTLLDLLDLDRPRPVNHHEDRSMSLLADVPEDRTCEDATIDAHWCTCHMLTSVSTHAPVVVAAAQHVVIHINLLLAEHPGVCAVLSLDGVTDARRIMTVSHTIGLKRNIHELLNSDVEKLSMSSQWSDYLVTFRTIPGEALFETTIRAYGHNNTDFSTIGEISRINRYGDQSMCIRYHGHEKYCFCQ